MLPVTFPGLSSSIWKNVQAHPTIRVTYKRHERDKKLKDVCLGLCVGKTHKLKCYKALWGVLVVTPPNPRSLTQRPPLEMQQNTTSSTCGNLTYPDKN